MKPRIFLGSSGQQAKLLDSLTRGLEQVADVEPWTTVFNPGTSTLARLVELTREVDFAAFVFAQDDWTSQGDAAGQASPRDNVVFEAGLFGGVLGMRRTFILHANGAKLPSDLLGLTCVRYAGTTAAEIKAINQKLRQRDRDRGPARQHRGTVVAALADHAHRAGALGREPAADLPRPRRRAGGERPVWQDDGTISARYWSEAAKELTDPSGVFYYWNGERPRDPDAPRLEGTGEIRLESVDRAAGYWTTRSTSIPPSRARTSGVYLRADPEDLSILDGSDQKGRAELIATKLDEWRAIASS